MKFVRNVLTLCALVALFSQGAFAQMPGTFSPLTAVAAGGALDCLGGTVTYVGGNTIHKFLTSATLDCTSARTVNYLIVAGGGGGGGTSYSGGGGAGGMLTGTASTPVGSTTVIVGSGGAGGAASQRGSNGGDSLIASPSGTGSFQQVIPNQSGFAAYGSGFGTYELRSRFTTAVYSGTAPSLGTQIRVTIGGGGTNFNQINAMYCGHAGGAGTSLNYDGNQVQIKFSGSASVVVPAIGSPLTSDAVNFSFDKSKDFICSVNWGSTQLAANNAAGANILTGSVASSTGAGNTTTTATGTANQLWVPVVKIEAFSNLTVVGSVVGGGGGGQYSTTPNGLSGGSGGGGAYGSGVAATGTAGQGNSGGFGGTCGGSGGGGAGGAGVNCSGTNGGNGGLGVASSITGASVFYAAGGAGGAYTGNGGTGGSGIGGNGGNYSPATACTSAAANTGSGGGGVSSTGPCAGGSGIVIVSYPSGIPVTGPPPTCTANTDGPGGAFSNVMALYHFDGNFNDSSGRGHTGTAVGGQTTSTAQFKFGSASLLGAVNKTVTVPVSNDFIFTGDFTFEYWAYLTAPTSASQSPVWANYNSAGGGWSMGVDISAPNTNSPNFYYGPTAASVTWSATTVGNAWRHWAFVRSGTTLNLYIDGTAVSPAKSVSGNVGDATYTISIGAGNTAGSPYYLGYLDEIRVSNIARYVANFTPPTLPFCNN